jgi:hypothetical protein
MASAAHGPPAPRALAVKWCEQWRSGSRFGHPKWPWKRRLLSPSNRPSLYFHPPRIRGAVLFPSAGSPWWQPVTEFLKPGASSTKRYLEETLVPTWAGRRKRERTKIGVFLSHLSSFCSWRTCPSRLPPTGGVSCPNWELELELSVSLFRRTEM